MALTETTKSLYTLGAFGNGLAVSASFPVRQPIEEHRHTITIDLSAEKDWLCSGISGSLQLYRSIFGLELRGASYAAAIATWQPVWRDIAKPQGTWLRFVGARLP